MSNWAFVVGPNCYVIVYCCLGLSSPDSLAVFKAVALGQPFISQSTVFASLSLKC